MNNTLCPCGTQSLFEHCCKPFITGTLQCKTAEQLMRSRYSAFAIGDVDYLLFTSSKQLKNQLTPAELQQTIDAFEFVRLEVLEANADCVEFCAYLLSDNVVHQLHEESRFIKENELWKYDTGSIKDTPAIKLARNDLCPCGSGKKYKKCHQA